MVIFQYNLYIFGIHLWTVLYPKPCYNERCYKEVEVYICMAYRHILIWLSTFIHKHQLGCVERKSAFEHVQRKVSSKPCSPFIHFVVINDSVSRQWRPWSDCADALKAHFHLGKLHLQLKVIEYTFKGVLEGAAVSKNVLLSSEKGSAFKGKNFLLLGPLFRRHLICK